MINTLDQTNPVGWDCMPQRIIFYPRTLKWLRLLSYPVYPIIQKMTFNCFHECHDEAKNGQSHTTLLRRMPKNSIWKIKWSVSLSLWWWCFLGPVTWKNTRKEKWNDRLMGLYAMYCENQTLNDGCPNKKILHENTCHFFGTWRLLRSYKIYRASFREKDADWVPVILMFALFDFL